MASAQRGTRCKDASRAPDNAEVSRAGTRGAEAQPSPEDPGAGRADADLPSTGAASAQQTAASTLDLAPLFASAFLVYGFNNVTMSALPEFVLSIGAEPFFAGMQNSLFVLMAVLLRFAFGHLADRFGSKLMLIVGAAGFCLPCAVIPLCDSLPEVLALRTLQAVGLAAYHPNVAHYITTHSSAASGSKRIGTARFMSTASLIIMPAVLFPLISAKGYPVFFSVLAFIAFAALLLLLPLPQSERVAHPRQSAPAARGSSPHQPRHGAPMTRIPDDARRLLPAIVLPLFLAIGYGAVLTFGPLFIKLVLPHENSGLLLTLISLGGLVGSLSANRIVTRWGSTRGVAALGVLFASGMALLAASAAGNVVAFGAGALIGVGYFGATTALVAELGRACPPHLAGSLFAAQQSCLDLGIMLGSLCSGAFLQAGASLPVAFCATSALIVLSLIAWRMRYNDFRRE